MTFPAAHPGTPPSTYERTLLQTKLHPPRLQQDVVPRPRLDALFAHGLAHKLLMVVAPAGYGKTTAVLLWAQQQDTPTAWLSLNAMHGGLPAFVTYLVAAIRCVAPGACANTDRLVQSGQAPAGVLHATLVNELSALEHPLVLVLDDYGSVSITAVHKFMAALIDDLPPSVHLVMTARSNPPLPLARWRANFDLVEIRAVDLRCEEDETPQLLAAMLGAPVNGGVVRILHARTEGWVTGLRLAALSMQRMEPGRLVAALERASTVNLRDYLLDEVFNRQLPAAQEFLLKTSILERFCAPLCAALLEDKTEPLRAAAASRAMIDHLTTTGLFVLSLDEQGEWYRYHQLFAELLRYRLHHLYGDEVVAALHRAAGHWFGGLGLVDEAVHHLLAGGDAPGAAEMIAGHVQHALNCEDWPQLEHWLALLPGTAVANHPVLLMAQAWCRQFQFAMTAVPPLLAQAEALLPAATRVTATVLGGQAAALRAQLALFSGDTAAVLAHAEVGVAQTPAEDRYVYSMGVYYRALALQMSGHSEEADGLLLDLLRAAQGRVDAFAIRLQFALCTNYRMRGELERLRAVAVQMLADAQAGHLALGEGWARVFLGYGAYETNNLAGAEFHFAAGTQLMFVAHAAAVRECLMGLALTQMVQRRFADAAKTVEQLRGFRFGLDVEIDSLAARLALSQGDGNSAARWALSFRPGPTPPFLYWQEVPQLSAAHILIAVGKTEHLLRALDLLQPLAAWAERSHCTWRIVECAVLQAAALAGLGREKAADQALHLALLRGQAAGYQRLFLDLGPKLQPLLSRRTRYKATAVYARQLLRALVAAPELQPPLAAHAGVEPLTAREQEVLLLLARRLSNKEIATELTIAPNTVKRHTLQIFAKLGVNDRRAAVEKARRAGLLD